MAFAFSDLPNLHHQLILTDRFPRGSDTGFPCSTRQVKCWGRCLLLTGEHIDCASCVHRPLPIPVPFGSSVSAIYTCCELRPLSQIHISSPYQLPSAHPVMATRRMGPSQVASRSSLKEDALLHCQRRSLFSLLGLLNSINSLIQTLDNSSCNLTSQPHPSQWTAKAKIPPLPFWYQGFATGAKN